MTPDLSQLEAAFAGEFPLQRVEPTDEIPLGQLAVVLDPDRRDRDRVLYLLLTPPVNAEDLYGLQFFALLPFQAASERFADLARLLLLINATLPLVGFGMSEDNGLVFFRCLLPIARGRALDPAEALHAAWLIYSSLDRFGDIIEGIAAGDLDYAQARRNAESVLAGLDDPDTD